MLAFKSLHSLWQRQSRFKQIIWIGRGLFLGYLIWHVLFITDLAPGPHDAMALTHVIFFLLFWCLLFLAIIPIGFIFPIATLREVEHRRLKIIGLGLLGILACIAALMTGWGFNFILFLILIILFDIWWILVTFRRCSEQVKLKNTIPFLGLLMLILLLAPIGGYWFEPLDSLRVEAWGKSYHASYMNLKAPGKLTLFECGPTKLFCRKIYHFCEYGGPSSDAKLSWADDRLSLSFIGTVIYELHQEDNKFIGYPISSTRFDTSAHNGYCRASQWN